MCYIEACGHDLRGNDALSPVSTASRENEHRWWGTIMVVKRKQLSVHTHTSTNISDNNNLGALSCTVLTKVVSGWELTLKLDDNILYF